MSRVLSYISDKNAEVRRLAVNALHNVYQNMDSSTILAHLSQASPQEQVCMTKSSIPFYIQNSNEKTGNVNRIQIQRCELLQKE